MTLRARALDLSASLRVAHCWFYRTHWMRTSGGSCRALLDSFGLVKSKPAFLHLLHARLASSCFCVDWLEEGRLREDRALPHPLSLPAGPGQAFVISTEAGGQPRPWRDPCLQIIFPAPALASVPSSLSVQALKQSLVCSGTFSGGDCMMARVWANSLLSLLPG